MKRSLFILLFGLTIMLVHNLKAQEQTDPGLLCVGNYWTEEEGAAFLEKMKQSYTAPRQWKSWSKEIKVLLLEGADVEKLPIKTPLSTSMGDVRTYDGYTVQDVALESLGGVYVTGSLYKPVGKNGKGPGIISPHGHGT